MKITVTNADGKVYDTSYLGDQIDTYIQRLVLNNRRVILEKLDGSTIVYEGEVDGED